jgi:hypothetical protein
MTIAPLMMRFLKPKLLGALTEPAKVTLWSVPIVTAVVPLLEASCNTPDVSALMFNAVLDVVPAETIEAMFIP